MIRNILEKAIFIANKIEENAHEGYSITENNLDAEYPDGTVRIHRVVLHKRGKVLFSSQINFRLGEFSESDIEIHYFKILSEIAVLGLTSLDNTNKLAEINKQGSFYTNNRTINYSEWER